MIETNTNNMNIEIIQEGIFGTKYEHENWNFHIQTEKSNQVQIK